MADATAEIIRENTANAPRPPQSHVAGLGMNEMNAMMEYMETIVIARLVKKFFMSIVVNCLEDVIHYVDDNVVNFRSSQWLMF